MPRQTRSPSASISSRSSRRKFVKQATAATLGFTLGAPAILRGQNLNNKLRIAVIGTGGRGGANLGSVKSEDIVALCDVNERSLAKPAELYPKAHTFADFRKLFDHAGEFDAVVVSTCEHTHAFATLAALQLGKHVYCEKPLTHNIWEARVIREAAARTKVATQMGIQIHAGNNYRRVVELVQTGAIGPVREAHVWVSRAWGWQATEEEATKNHDIVFFEQPPAVRRRCRPASTGTYGWVQHRIDLFTKCISPARSGTAGGILAMAPCRTSEATGMISPSGRSSCGHRSRSKPRALRLTPRLRRHRCRRRTSTRHGRDAAGSAHLVSGTEPSGDPQRRQDPELGQWSAVYRRQRDAALRLRQVRAPA